MNDGIRTGRTLSATIPKLTEQDAHMLAQLRLSPSWPVLLDVLEKFCIEVDTQLVNIEVGNDSAIIAHHTKTQVAWQMFDFIQRHILAAAQLDQEVYGGQSVSPLTPAQAETEDFLSPIRHDPPPQFPPRG